MQYKESEDMADTPTVQLLANGDIKCAKGLDISECGYKPGAKVCGKCGATAVAVKDDEFESDWVEDSTTETTENVGDVEEKASAAKPTSPMEVMAAAVADEEDEEEEDDMKEDAVTAVDGDDQMDDEEEEKMWGQLEEMLKNRKNARKKRMESMGVKSEQFDGDEQAFVCAIERKMYPGGSDICANCPGGCEPHENMPTLLEVEGIAEDMFSGKILDSGYADKTDIFVVDVQRKDGKPIEAYFDGTTGECMGWHLLNEDLIGEVATVPGEKVISFDEAASIATKSIEGEVVAVDADMFEGYDAYAVEIEGTDGKSYDVFVGVDGEVLGYDEYDAEEASDIDEEVADLALKRMYSDDRREELAKEGMALPDGSFPIVDEADLQNAIQAFGRAGDKEAAKKHIMKRARDLGKEEMIPENWMDGEKSLVETGEEKLSDDEAKNLIGSLMEFEMLALEIEQDGETK
jgi:uncharacterized membrane protein YkoI